MNTYNYMAIPTNNARYVQSGGHDSHGQIAEESISDGQGNQCRHCLELIPEGKPILVFSYCPFPSPQPYAESGPIFICKNLCQRRDNSPEMPAMYREWDTTLLRGYDTHNRIVSGTGIVLAVDEIDTRILKILSNSSVAYIHLRSSTNNCFQCRIERSNTE